MGLFIKSDLEKLLKEAEKKALIPDKQDATSGFGERMRKEMANTLGRHKKYNQHLEGKISGGSIFFTPFNKLTKKGRAFEDLMAKQGSEEYNQRFVTHYKTGRHREDHEREPDNPIYNRGDDKYNPNAPEFIQDVPHTTTRAGFAMYKGKNDVVVDLVLTGRLYSSAVDDGGFMRRILNPMGEPGRANFVTGQYNSEQEPIFAANTDDFHAEYAKRVEEANQINREKLEALGYDLLAHWEDGYVEQQQQIDADPRFIETFPDLTDLPKVKMPDGSDVEPEYDIVIHINGQKVQPQDMDLAFDQLARQGLYQKTGLEKGRDFAIEQGMRGAAFHASIIPQRMAEGVIKAPGKLSREGQQTLNGVLSHLINALTRGMSR